MEREAHPFVGSQSVLPANAASGTDPFSWTGGQSARETAPSNSSDTGVPKPKDSTTSRGSLCVVYVKLTAFFADWDGDPIYSYANKCTGGNSSTVELYEEVYSDTLPSRREISINDAREADRVINRHLNFILEHFEKRGFFRCDGISDLVERDERDILLVALHQDGDIAPWTWAVSSEDLSFNSETASGHAVRVTFETEAIEFNATSYEVFGYLTGGNAASTIIHWWGTRVGNDRLPKPGESFEDWFDRIAITKGELDRQIRLLERVGHDFELYDIVDQPKEEEIQFIVPGLIPRGMVGLLVGGTQIGKSTLMDELCAKLECSLPGVTPDFLGISLIGGMTTVFLSGEDPINIFTQRRAALAKIWGEGSGMVIDATTRSFDELLGLIRRIPKVDMIVFDPARRFIVGDEDSSGNVSAFFQDLVALAQEKDCTIIVVQHGKKGHQPRSLKEISPRGSGVFLDRPRFVLGMLQNADGSIGIGLLKHNMPPNVPMWERGKARYFKRDPETLSLIPIGLPQASQRTEEPAQADDDHVREGVFEAVARLNAQGEVVQQTGKRELFQLNLPSLAGLSRATLRAATAKLVQIGRLELGPTGLIAKPTKTQ